MVGQMIIPIVSEDAHAMRPMVSSAANSSKSHMNPSFEKSEMAG